MGRVLLCLITIALLTYPIEVWCADKQFDKLTAGSGGHAQPGPFNPASDWTRDQPAISTGYYMLNSEDPVNLPMRPDAAALLRPLDQDPQTWHRIVSGPNQFPAEHWTTNKEGRAYFRNPGDANDSTDNAFAGPITIGFPFYFNGVRYDSFYVSSNGLIALSNRRYFYNSSGNRSIPSGQATAWDPQSDDTRMRSDAQNTNGVNDVVADDWGYYYVACGGDPEDPIAGIRAPRNTPLDKDAFELSGMIPETPLIAAFWDDWHLPQFNNETNKAEDYGQVWYKRSEDNQELTIYFVNLSPIGAKQHPEPRLPDIQFAKNARSGDGKIAFAVNAHVTLRRKDSSVVVLTHKYTTPLVVVNNRPVSPDAIVRQNVTMGLRGQARYKDDEGKVQRYLQYTEGVRNGEVFVRESFPPHPVDNVLGANNATHFQQHKNLFRAVRIEFLTKDPQTLEYSVPVADPNNYELLIGDNILGLVKPVVIYQNMSNDVQGIGGVNYREQDGRFRATFQVRNEVLKDTLVYNRSVCVDSMTLARGHVTGVRLVNYHGEPLDFDGNGVPPYGFVQVTFPEFGPGFQPHLIGRLRAEALAQSVACDDTPLGEGWTYDNTCSIQLFGVKVLSSIVDNVRNFEFGRRGELLPTSLMWVSHGVDVVDGRKHTFNPPPPLSELNAGESGSEKLYAPVMRLNRVDLLGRDLAPGGDELSSFPIDLRKLSSAVLSFSYQRTGIPPSNTFDRGWSDAVRLGPEARVVENGQWETSAPLQEPDVLELHFANPSPDGLNNIVNIPVDGWSVHPNSADPDNPITDNPAFTVFGGGGYRRGFHEDNPDSALTRAEGLRYDSLDTGKDPAFVKAFVPLPDYIMNVPDDGNRFFRFKFKVKARDNGSFIGPVDDFDDFYIDNIAIMDRTETPDIEVSMVSVGSQSSGYPYSAVPASQASLMPLHVKLTNNSNLPSRSFAVRVMVHEVVDDDNLLVYCAIQTQPFLRAKTESIRSFPVWNARRTRPGKYILGSNLNIPGGDPNPLNDSTSSFYTLNFSNYLAYDEPGRTGKNSAVDFTQTIGKGLNLRAYSSGRFTAASAYGDDAGSSSGRIAVAFEINRLDTIQGYQVYFAALAVGRPEVHFAVHADNGGKPAPNPVAGSFMRRERGRYDLDAMDRPTTGASDDLLFDVYATYLLPAELALQPGKYWMVVSQTGQEGFELGASAYRMGMQTLNYTGSPQPGESSASVLLANEWRSTAGSGGPELLNNNYFLYVNSLGGDDWQPFTPTVGNPAYAHLDHAGEINGLRTYTRASWIPMLRPYFGLRTYANPPWYIDECPAPPPVELVDFSGVSLPPAGIELYWLTASESGNAGFYVERRTVGAGMEFNSIAFVEGAGTSTSQLHYDLLDAEVERGSMYEYRLRQVDFDGTIEFSRSLTLEYDYADAPILTHRPNPISEFTDLSFGLPSAAPVRLEILDVFGNSVRLLTDETMRPTAQTTLRWDTCDERGQKVAAGVYFCRLTVGDQTTIEPLNIVR